MKGSILTSEWFIKLQYLFRKKSRTFMIAARRHHWNVSSHNSVRARPCHVHIAEFLSKFCNLSTPASHSRRRQVVDEDAEPADGSRKKQLIITSNRSCKHCNTKSKRLFNDHWCGPRGGGSVRDVSCSDPPRDERKVLRTGPPSSGRERVRWRSADRY